MRKYKWTEEGEKPVWASRKRIQQMAVEDAARDFKLPAPTKRPHMGNLDYDKAYEEHWEWLSNQGVVKK